MWVWDPEEGRFYNVETGEHADRDELLALIAASLLLTGIIVDDMALMVIDEVITTTGWHIAMQEQIKREYIRQYMLGLGGRAQMTAVDWNVIGEMLADQYQYLEGFVEVLPELSEAQIAARSKLYINSARRAYETARGRVAIEMGFDEETWILDPFADHCPDCEEFEAMGWQSVGTFPMPGDGSTVCMSNCHCHKAYRNSGTGEEWDG